MADPHARLAPSSAYRWVACPGSVDLIKSLPAEQQDKPNEHSRRGVAAHKVLEQVLQGRTDPNRFIGTPIEGSTEGAKLVAEDTAAIKVAQQYVFSRITELQNSMMDVKVFTEHHVHPGRSFHACSVDPVAWDLGQPPEGDKAPFPMPREDCSGTSDIIIIGGGMLEVLDYKHGVGYVDEVDNLQTLLYGIGSLRECMQGEAQTVRLTIIQPRCFRDDVEDIRFWDITDRDLMAWSVKFNNAAVRTDDPATLQNLVPGDVQCKWCPAKPTCPAIAEQAAHIAVGTPPDVPGLDAFSAPMDLTIRPEGAPVSAPTDTAIEAALLTPVDKLPVAQLGRIMDRESLMRAWLDSVRAHVTTLVRNGTRVPGEDGDYKMVKGKRSKSYTLGEEAMLKKLGNVNRADKSTGNKLKKTEFTETKLISPAQMEKRIKPLVSEATWKNLAATIKLSDGAHTLAPASDTRAPVRPTVETMFPDTATDEDLMG